MDKWSKEHFEYEKKDKAQSDDEIIREMIEIDALWESLAYARNIDEENKKLEAIHDDYPRLIPGGSIAEYWEAIDQWRIAHD
jgi:tRNA splicing ligase